MNADEPIVVDEGEPTWDETCHFCGATLPRDEVIEAGWWPSFWRGDDEVLEPTCVPCQRERLRWDEATGEYEAT